MNRLNDTTVDFLTDFDQRNGSRLLRAAQKVLEIDPAFAGVSVLTFPVEEVECVYFAYDYDVGSYIILYDELEAFPGFLDMIYAHRVKELVEYFGYESHKDIPSDVLATFFLGHESKHALEFARGAEERGLSLIEYAFIDEAATHRTYFDLPLALPTSYARTFWNDNTGGYRSYLEGVGYDQAHFEAKCAENAIAYNQVPFEHDADLFGVKVVALTYPELIPRPV